MKPVKTDERMKDEGMLHVKEVADTTRTCASGGILSPSFTVPLVMQFCYMHTLYLLRRSREQFQVLSILYAS